MNFVSSSLSGSSERNEYVLGFNPIMSDLKLRRCINL